MEAVYDDFDRILDHMANFGVENPAARITDIVQAFDILTRSPLIGRPVKEGKRELVIGRGARGYIALYRFIEPIDAVFILAVRGQSEAGYRPR